MLVVGYNNSLFKLIIIIVFNIPPRNRSIKQEMIPASSSSTSSSSPSGSAPEPLTPPTTPNCYLAKPKNGYCNTTYTICYGKHSTTSVHLF